MRKDQFGREFGPFRLKFFGPEDQLLYIGQSSDLKTRLGSDP